jgi:hypothetical protein
MESIIIIVIVLVRVKEEPGFDHTARGGYDEAGWRYEVRGRGLTRGDR